MSEASTRISTKKDGLRRLAVLATFALVVLALLGWGVSVLLGGKSKPPPKAPKITLLAPPPPPPPPPKFEKKPDPPKAQKEIKEPPKPKEAPPQPSSQVNIEGKAGDGPSPYGNGPITNEDFSKMGNGMFNPFNNYANLLKGDLQRYLKKNNALRNRHYSIEVHVWVADGGELKRFELIGSTGDSDTDGAIRQAMSSLPGFKQAQPANMPQPIKLRIVVTS